MFRFGAIQYPLFSPDDPLAPGTGGSAGRVKCDFCACSLAADGAVLTTSPRARELAKIEETLEKSQAELATTKATLQTTAAELADAKAELVRLRPAPAPLDDDDDD